MKDLTLLDLDLTPDEQQTLIKGSRVAWRNTAKKKSKPVSPAKPPTELTSGNLSTDITQ